MQKEKFNPKYLGIWLVVGLLNFTAAMPVRFQVGFVVFLGYILKPFLRGRNKITKINLQIAFPEKSEKEIDSLVKKCYRSMILSGAETATAWCMSKKRFNKIDVEFEGNSREIFERYHNDPNTTLITLGFHFHCIEIIGRYFGENYDPLTVMYQKHSNPLIEELIKEYRERNIKKCLDSKNFISVIRSLKRGNTMWYAPDQDFGLDSSGIKNSVFAPFFGKDCATLTVTPWLAQKSGAVVVPVYYVREKCLQKYKVVMGEPLNFTGDEYEDAKITNEFLENAVRKYPEQYLWQHRRYRTRPNGEPQIY